MLSKSARWILIVICLCLIGSAVGFHLWLNHEGICRATWSRLSNEAAIQAAVRSSARWNWIADLPDSPTDEQIKSYLELHPKCCVVLADPVLSEPLEEKKTWVKLLYQRKPRIFYNYKEDVPTYYEVYVPISPCGKAGRSWGTTISEAEFQKNIR